MKRWLVVLMVALISGLGLVGVRGYSGQVWVADEILAYEISDKHHVVALVPGAAQRVTLSSWLIAPASAPHDPALTYPYALRVALMTTDGDVLFERTLETVSRVSGDPAAPITGGKFAARLVRSNDWVTDSRTASIDVSSLAGRPGLLSVLPAEETQGTVLIRLSFAQSRSAVGRELVSRTLDAEQRRKIVAGRSALGFADLPPVARERALATWGRRLSLRGREGTEYATRRLLIGDYRFAPDDDPMSYAGKWVGDGHHLAFNFSGPVKLRVHAPAGTLLEISEDEQDPFEVLVTASGQADIPLPGARARSVRIGSSRRAEVHFSMSADDATRQLGSVEQTVRGQRVIVTPDVRPQFYVDLHPTDSVVFSIAGEQELLGLSIRARVDAEKSIPVHGRLKARWRGSSDEVFELDADLPRSPFESSGNHSITDARTTLLRVPDGATALELTGDPWIFVTAWTDEPDVEERQLDPTYEMDLGEDRTWRYAPFITRTTANVRPDNFEQLRAGSRVRSVHVQTRIETIKPSTSIDERVLRPVGTPIARNLLMPSYHSAGAPAGATTWSPITPDEKQFLIASSGHRARELEVFYRAAEEAIGEDVSLTVDGEEALKRPITFRSGSLNLPLDPGLHGISIIGLGDNGQAYASAAPAAGGAVVKRQNVFELSKERPLSFDFARSKDELLTCIVFVVSENGPLDFRVYYRLDDGKRANLGAFLRRLTEFSGVLTGRTGVRGRGTLWEAGDDASAREPAPDFVGEARLPTGDDLEAGPHRLRLSIPQDDLELWVRVVLVGRKIETPTESQP